MRIPPMRDVQGGIVEDGWHEFMVAKAEEKESKAGNPMIAVALGMDGGMVLDYLVLIDTSLWKCKAFLSAIGCKQENLDEGFDMAMGQLIGKTGWVQTEIVTEKWEGKTRTKAQVQRYAKAPPKYVQDGAATVPSPLEESEPF